MIPAEILKKVRRIQILTSALVNDVFAGQYHSAFKGRGMEFEDVREYQPGDDIRSIDWNVTARMGRPFIKNFREERELTVLLLVDVSASQDFGTRGQLKSELVAELGATLAFSAIQNNDKVGLILFTDRIERFVPARKGTRHVLRVVREFNSLRNWRVFLVIAKSRLVSSGSRTPSSSKISGSIFIVIQSVGLSASPISGLPSQKGLRFSLIFFK